MQKWEYKVLELTEGFLVDYYRENDKKNKLPQKIMIAEFLGQLGEEGWELIEVEKSMMYKNMVMMYFKRGRV